MDFKRYCFIVLVMMFFASPLAAMAEKYSLTEQADDGRVFGVQFNGTVEGKLKTAASKGKVITMPLKVKANLYFHERRLSGTGRNAETLRTLRYYERAAAEIDVADQINFNQLSSTHKLIVAQGTRERILFYSPTQMMKPDDIELLNVPGDSLAMLGFLPDEDVNISDTWEPESWVIQMLTSTEAISKSKLVCKLESVKNGIAHVSFEGTVDGATSGTDAKSTIKGNYQYDIAKKHISQVELTQTEKRSVGATSPGMDVTATIKFTRTLVKNKKYLTDKLANSIPLNPDPKLLKVTFDSAWRTRIRLGRSWKVFHQNTSVAVLRLLEKGSFIAQCNMAYVPTVASGQHLPEKKFVANVRSTLGDRLEKIVQQEEVKTGDKQYLYRVISTGTANKIKMHWIHYLSTAPDGRQTSFTFSVESKLVEKLADRDLEIVKSIQYLSPSKAPQPIQR